MGGRGNKVCFNLAKHSLVSETNNKHCQEEFVRSSFYDTQLKTTLFKDL